MLQSASGKKLRERVCTKCEESIDCGSHGELEPCKEHELAGKAGLGMDFDQENDPSRINQQHNSGKFVAFDGASKKKMMMMSPGKLNRSGNSFTFTNYLLSPPTNGASSSSSSSSSSNKKKKEQQQEHSDMSSVSVSVSDLLGGGLSEGSTVMDTTDSTVTANGSMCNNSVESSICFNESTDGKTVAIDISDPNPNLIVEEGDVGKTTAASHDVSALSVSLASGYSADDNMSNRSITSTSIMSMLGMGGSNSDARATAQTPDTAVSAGAGAGAGVDSGKSTVLTNASITSNIHDNADGLLLLSTEKAQSYEDFVNVMEGRGTVTRPNSSSSSSVQPPALPSVPSAGEDESEEDAGVEEDREGEGDGDGDGAVDKSVLNESNKSFSQKLLEVRILLYYCSPLFFSCFFMSSLSLSLSLPYPSIFAFLHYLKWRLTIIPLNQSINQSINQSSIGHNAHLGLHS
jgi:hypothetical protein